MVAINWKEVIVNVIKKTYPQKIIINSVPRCSNCVASSSNMGGQCPTFKLSNLKEVLIFVVPCVTPK